MTQPSDHIVSTYISPSFNSTDSYLPSKCCQAIIKWCSRYQWKLQTKLEYNYLVKHQSPLYTYSAVSMTHNKVIFRTRVPYIVFVTIHSLSTVCNIRGDHIINEFLARLHSTIWFFQKLIPPVYYIIKNHMEGKSLFNKTSLHLLFLLTMYEQHLKS